MIRRYFTGENEKHYVVITHNMANTKTRSDSLWQMIQKLPGSLDEDLGHTSDVMSVVFEKCMRFTWEKGLIKEALILDLLKQKTEKSVSVSSSEYSDEELKDLVHMMKRVLKKIHNKLASLEISVQQWFDTFDADKSNRIDPKELAKMVNQYLKIETTEKQLFIIMFLFDKEQRDYFTAEDLKRVLNKEMTNKQFRKLV